MSKQRTNITTMPNKEGHTYNMRYKRKGLLLIIGIENFDGIPKKQRHGTERDVEALDKTFSNLNFEVQQYKDLNSEDMEEAIEKAVKEEKFKGKPVFECKMNAAGCFAVAIMTHGGEDGQLGGSKGDTTIRKLAAPLRGRLFGKPKIFIIQACRGDRVDTGIVGGTDGVDEHDDFYRIPMEADFLYAFSTVEGYPSARSPQLGSWFIQSLCKCFEQYPKEEVIRILTRVNRMLAIEYETQNKQKQMPSIVSQLTRELYFKASWSAWPLLVVLNVVIVPILSVVIYRAMF